MVDFEFADELMDMLEPYDLVIDEIKWLELDDPDPKIHVRLKDKTEFLLTISKYPRRGRRS